MKKRWWSVFPMLLLVGLLCFPFLRVHPHRQLEAELASAFPASLSGYDVMLKGAGALPLERLPALSVASMRGEWLAIGTALLLLSCVLCVFKKRWMPYAAFIAALAALLLFLGEAFHLQSLCGSLLFNLLLNADGWIWSPVAIAFGQIVLVLALRRHGERPNVSDRAWRTASGALCLASVLCLLLPIVVTDVPAGFVVDRASVAAMRQSETMLDAALARQPMLSQIALEKGVFGDVLTDGLLSLEPLSGDAANIRGMFTIKSSAATPDVILLLAGALLLGGVAMAFLFRINRWFPMLLSAMGALLAAIRLPGVMMIGAGDMFGTATRQLCYLGVGHITLAPMAFVFFATLAVGAGALGIRHADVPYFINPVPQNMRLRATALLLGVLSFALILSPSFNVSFYKPGKTKVQSVAQMNGLDALLWRAPANLLHPVDNKGKPLYKEKAGSDELSAAAVENIMGNVVTYHHLTTLASLALCVAAIAMLLARKDRRLIIALLIGSLALRLFTWILWMCCIPKAIGAAEGMALLYLSLFTLLFAAFFSNFAHLEQMPKKYRLFLMILPFLAAVFLFSYLPLYGWSYAFFNYKFGLPMSEQEFVGLKWFAEIFTNPGHRANMIRVMKNTFAMSGLGLLTSWLPMAFAILLNEVNRSHFKKFVQIFTTLPNFISWALVFSFALAMFNLDTGIYNKFLLSVGALDSPLAWLNSSEHIWIKMWAWSTWKGLGWGAIMYLAAIAGIDQELYEAARVDGAGRWKQIRHITLPGLLPTFFVLLLLSISNLVNNGMEQYLVFQNSINKDVIEVLDLYVYNITIASKGTSLYSFGTAIGILKTLFSVTLLFGANFASKKLRGESIV